MAACLEWLTVAKIMRLFWANDIDLSAQQITHQRCTRTNAAQNEQWLRVIRSSCVHLYECSSRRIQNCPVTILDRSARQGRSLLFCVNRRNPKRKASHDLPLRSRSADCLGGTAVLLKQNRYRIPHPYCLDRWYGGSGFNFYILERLCGAGASYVKAAAQTSGKPRHPVVHILPNPLMCIAPY